MNWVIVGFKLAAGIALFALVILLVLFVGSWVWVKFDEWRERKRAERDLSRAQEGWYFLAVLMLMIGVAVAIHVANFPDQPQLRPTVAGELPKEGDRKQFKQGWGLFHNDQWVPADPVQQLSAYDRQALEWANANPNDPRAAQIKAHLQDPLAAARDAIAKGAPRDAVIRRLQEQGINPAGL